MSVGVGHYETCQIAPETQKFFTMTRSEPSEDRSISTKTITSIRYIVTAKALQLDNEGPTESINRRTIEDMLAKMPLIQLQLQSIVVERLSIGSSLGSKSPYYGFNITGLIRAQLEVTKASCSVKKTRDHHFPLD